jgi:hypothetical protein
MRGKYYIWISDADDGTEERIHLWGGIDPVIEKDKSYWADWFAADQALGASMPLDIFDELVVMRYAELQAEEKAQEIEQRAMKKYSGNIGCDDLNKRYGRPTALERLEKRLKLGPQQKKDKA